MALTEETRIDQMVIDEYGNVSVRSATRVARDGEVIAQTYHRRTVAAGEQVDDITDANALAVLAAVATLTWTPVPEPEIP